MPKISVCKNCDDLISDFEKVRCEGYCFYCFEEKELEEYETKLNNV